MAKSSEWIEKIAKSRIEEAESNLKYLSIILTIIVTVLTVLSLYIKDIIEPQDTNPQAIFIFATVLLLVNLLVVGGAWWKYRSDLSEAYQSYRQILWDIAPAYSETQSDAIKSDLLTERD